MAFRGRYAVLFCLCAVLPAAAAYGEEARKKIGFVADPSPAWTVAVAAFDTAALEASDRLAGELVVNRLSRALSLVPEHRYPDEERGAYMRRLVAKATDSALKELAAKQASRDALLFSGLEEWKYEIELKKAEDAVRSARGSFEETRRATAEVAPVKELKLAKENAAGALVSAPKKGEERSACEKYACDALLLGRIESFYGRTFVAVRLYSPFLNADLYTDETVFSTLDRDAALSELARRVSAAASGAPPSVVSVKATPPDADVQLNGVFAGTGSAGPLERESGRLRISAERKGYERFDETIDLFPSERTTVTISLPAFATSSLAFDALGLSGEKQEANVRLNGLFVGRTPLSLAVPRNRYSLLQMDGPTVAASGGQSGTLVSAAAVVNPENDGAVTLSLTADLPKEAKPVEDARKAFYGAFGRFSLVMPFAFIVSGIGFSYENSAIVYNSTALADLEGQVKLASTVLWTVSGLFAVESIWRFVKYLRDSGSRAVKSAPISGS